MSVFPRIRTDSFGLIHSECRKIQTVKTPNMDTFHAVLINADLGHSTSRANK